MIKWLRIVLYAILIVVVIFGLINIYKIFTPSNKKEVYITSKFLGAEKVKKLFTGFAYVSKLKLYNENKTELTPRAIKMENENIDGYCYTLYEIGLGFSNLPEALQTYQNNQNIKSIPEIISINAKETKFGGIITQYDCEWHNLSKKREFLKKDIIEQMKKDGQWELQVKNSSTIISSLSEVIYGSKNRNVSSQNIKMGFNPGIFSIFKKKDSRIEGSTPGTGFIGSLELTFSATIITSQQGQWIISPDKFYIRKDIAKANYGSKFSISDIYVQENSGSVDYLNVILEQPKMVSLDRFISLLVVLPEYYSPDKERTAGEKKIEEKILSTLQKQLENINERAVDLSKDITKMYLYEIARQMGYHLRITFKKPIPPDSSRIIDFL